MNNDIKNPIFIIAEDGTIIFLQDSSEVDCCGIEPIDVADGVYTAYDSEGQILKLITINEDNGKIEGPTENMIIKIPFLGKITSVAHDRVIKIIPEKTKDSNKLMQILSRDLSNSEGNIDGLALNKLVDLYQRKHKKITPRKEDKEKP